MVVRSGMTGKPPSIDLLDMYVLIPLPAQPVQLADDDPNDASDVGGGDGAQEDGALLLGCQAAQVAEKHANTSTKARSSQVQLDSNFHLGHLLGNIEG